MNYRILLPLRLLLIVLFGLFGWNALAGLGAYDPAIYTSTPTAVDRSLAFSGSWIPTLGTRVGRFDDVGFGLLVGSVGPL